jgi:hypothetical protein
MEVTVEISDSTVVQILKADLEKCMKWDNYDDQLLYQAFKTLITYYSN